MKVKYEIEDAMAAAIQAHWYPEIRGMQNSTFEDECRPAAKSLVGKLRRLGYKIIKIRKP